MGIITRNTGVYAGTLLGTATGTTTILSEPGIIYSVFFPNRVASGQAIIYDSAGTSGTVIGTIVLGTQTFSDPPIPYVLNMRTNNGLTVVNSANQSVLVTYGV